MIKSKITTPLDLCEVMEEQLKTFIACINGFIGKKEQDKIKLQALDLFDQLVDILKLFPHQDRATHLLTLSGLVVIVLQQLIADMKQARFENLSNKLH